MKTIFRNIMITLLGASMMTSCGAWTNESGGALLGGLGGAMLGGAFGEMMGGPRGNDIGTFIGATVGTVAGASIGREKDRQEAASYYSGNNGGYSYSYQENYDDNYQSNYSSGYQSKKSYYDEGSGLTYVRMNSDGDLAFDSNSSQLTGKSTSSLNRIFYELQRCNNDIYVYGSADGRERDSQRLSQNRADAVKRWLVNRGISPRRINVVALGNGSPIGNNNTSRGRELNRSVEIFITK